MVLYATTGARMGYDGYVLLALDASSPTVYAFQADSNSDGDDDNNAYPNLIDNSDVIHNVAQGVVAGAFSLTGVFDPSRGWPAFLTSAFGPRTNGAMTDWTATVVSNEGATPVNYGNIFFEQFSLSARFGLGGDVLMMRYTLQGMIMDPRGVGSPPTLAAPVTSGSTGQLASFGTTAFSNGATSPTAYDLIRSVDVTFRNGYRAVPTMSDTTNRLSPGCIPNAFRGGVRLTQMLGAVNALPLTTGSYPIQMVVPIPGGSHSATFQLSTRWDRKARTLASDDFNTIPAQYTIQGFNSFAGTLATWPFIATYA